MALPLEVALQGISDSEFYAFRSDLFLYADHEYLVVPRTEEALEWCEQQLLAGESEQLAEMVTRLVGSFSEYEQLYRATLSSSGAPPEPNQLSCVQLLQLLHGLAERGDNSEDPLALLDLLLRHPSPFREQGAVETALNRYLCPVQIGQEQVWVPRPDPGERGLLDLVAPDYSCRLWIVPGRDHWVCVAIRNQENTREGLSRTRAEDTEVRHFPEPEQVLEWAGAQLQRSPGCAEARAVEDYRHLPGQPVRAEQFSMLNLQGETRHLGDTQELLGIYAPAEREAHARWGPSGHVLAYDTRDWLLSRAEKLQIPDADRLGDDELRVEIGEAAARALPMAELFGDRRAAFVEPLTREELQKLSELQPQQDVLALESLIVHCGSGGLAGASVQPMGVRLGENLAPRRVVRPRSPFLPAADPG